MNNEVKEILNNLEIVARKHTIAVCEDGSKIERMTASCFDELRLNNYSSKLLLDYISNLQQKVEQYENPDDLTLFYMWLDEKAKDKMKKLQQRIDKAIEYINLYAGIDNNYCLDYHDLNPLLNILKGDSDV